MADFNKAFEEMIKAEGGYSKDPDDPGGETYKGVARSRNPKWPGWTNVDLNRNKTNFPKNLDYDEDLQQKVRDLYTLLYWEKVRGDEIADQDIAEAIFDFGVNAGPTTSVRLAQMSADAHPDGVMGPDTLTAINAKSKREFLAVFALAKINRYMNICKDPKSPSRKYFYGWVKRTLEGV
jgi:lysozyme family protein